jgi:hypothetical protein
VTAVAELIKTMEWVMDSVLAAYKVAERDGLRDDLRMVSGCQLEVSTHHGAEFQLAWFSRMRTGAKVMHLSSQRLQTVSEEHARSMILNCLASFLQWCQHDIERLNYARAAHHEIRKVRKPKVPMYGDAKWEYYRQAVDAIWRSR